MLNRSCRSTTPRAQVLTTDKTIAQTSDSINDIRIMVSESKAAISDSRDGQR